MYYFIYPRIYPSGMPRQSEATGFSTPALVLEFASGSAFGVRISSFKVDRDRSVEAIWSEQCFNSCCISSGLAISCLYLSSCSMLAQQSIAIVRIWTSRQGRAAVSDELFSHALRAFDARGRGGDRIPAGLRLLIAPDHADAGEKFVDDAL